MDKIYIINFGNGYYCKVQKDGFYQQPKENATRVNLKDANIILDSLIESGVNATLEFGGDTHNPN